MIDVPRGLRCSPIPMAPLFQPISGIISDPVERAGLRLETGNVFLLPIWIGAYDMPLNPKLAGKWSEREFAYGLGHSGNMRRIPEGGHPRPRSALIQTAPLSGIQSELEAMEGVGG